MDTISIIKITKENNSTKNAAGATVVNLCTSSVMFYISTKFCEIILKSIKVIEWTRIDKQSILHVHICNIVLIMPYICAKFHEIISNGIKVIEWTQFLL